MYSNESERANLDIYDDFKLKKPFGAHAWLMQKFFSVIRVSNLAYVRHFLYIHLSVIAISHIIVIIYRNVARRRPINTPTLLDNMSHKIEYLVDTNFEPGS